MLVSKAVHVQRQAAELKAGLVRVQCSIVAARERHQQLQGQRSQMTQRCSNVCALEAMKSVTRMMTSVPATASAPPEPSTCFPDNSTAATPAVATPTVVVRTAHRQHRALFEPSSTVPPPLTTYEHHRTVSVEQLKAFSRCRAPSTPFPSTSGSSPAVSQFTVRKLNQEFRSSEAERCGCGVSDIAWFCTTHVNVVGDSTAGTAGILSRDSGDVGSSIGEMASFSSTFSSGPCIASFLSVFLHFTLENALSQQALALLHAAVPGLSPLSCHSNAP